MTDSERMALAFIDEGILRIDEYGRLWRMMHHRGHLGTPWKPCVPPTLLDHRDRNGYLQLQFSHHGVKRSVQVNRLVYLVTHRTIDDALQIDHIDFDPGNNHPDNLQQLPRLENNRRTRRAGRGLKFTDAQIREIRRRAVYESHRSLALEFNCDTESIRRTYRRKQYMWVLEEQSA